MANISYSLAYKSECLFLLCLCLAGHLHTMCFMLGPKLGSGNSYLQFFLMAWLNAQVLGQPPDINTFQVIIHTVFSHILFHLLAKMSEMIKTTVKRKENPTLPPGGC